VCHELPTNCKWGPRLKILAGTEWEHFPKPILFGIVFGVLIWAWTDLQQTMILSWLPFLWWIYHGFSNIENTWLRRAVKVLFAVLAILPSRYIGAAVFFTAHLSPCLTCNGHFAGYEWARDKYDYEEKVRCSNPSKSFRRGCEIYMNGY
jgi:hypothetical protein